MSTGQHEVSALEWASVISILQIQETPEADAALARVLLSRLREEQSSLDPLLESWTERSSAERSAALWKISPPQCAVSWTLHTTLLRGEGLHAKLYRASEHVPTEELLELVFELSPKEFSARALQFATQGVLRLPPFTTQSTSLQIGLYGMDLIEEITAESRAPSEEFMNFYRQGFNRPYDYFISLHRRVVTEGLTPSQEEVLYQLLHDGTAWELALAAASML